MGIPTGLLPIVLSIVECRLSNRDRSSIIGVSWASPRAFYLFLLLVNFVESEFLPKSMDFGEDWNQIMQRVADNVEEQCKKDGGKFNETAISRAVVRSQPKQASDVPSWVTFVRRWGGGTSPRFTREWNQFFQAGLIPTGRMISIGFFDTCNKLKLPPDFQPIAFINAMLLVHASSDNVVDSISRHITASDISSIASRNKTKVQQAEQVLRNARKMATEMDLTPQSKAKNLLTLYKDIVDPVLEKVEKSKTSTKPLSVTEAAQKFVKAISGMEEEAPQTAIENANPSAPASSVCAPVQFSEDGAELDTFKLSLENQGFKVQGLVFKKDNNSYHQKQFVIKDLKPDGVVVLHRIMLDGQAQEKDPVEVPHKDFLKSYGNCKTKNKLFELKPQHQPSGKSTFQHLERKGMVHAALVRLQSMHTCECLDFLEQPKTGAFVNKPVENLVLVPSTFSITVEEDPSKNLKQAWFAEADGHTERFVLNRQPVAQDFCAAFWLVRVVDKESDANMTINKVKMDVDFARLHGEKRKRVLAVIIPTLQSVRPLQVGEDLTVFRGLGKEVKKESEPLMCLAPKRNKVD